MKKSAYIVFPILLPFILHCIIAYGTFSFNPAEWSEETRTVAAFLMVIGITGGVVIAGYINRIKD
jgi:hypothetical protein